MAKAKEIAVTVHLIQKTGLVLVATTMFPASTHHKKIVKRIIEILNEGGSPTHCLDFQTTYTNVEDTINVMVFTPHGSGQFAYERPKDVA